MGCLKMVPKGNLSEIISNWQISIGYEDNQIMTRGMDYLHLIPCSLIWTLLASALGTAASLPQLLAGLPPRASTIVLWCTSPGTPCHAFPSPKLPAWPSPLPHAWLSPLPHVPPSLLLPV